MDRKLAVIIIVIVICFTTEFITPNDNDTETSEIPTNSYPEIVWIDHVEHTISTPTPELDPIDILFNEIVENDAANKDHYSKIGGSKNVHICGNMACEQSEWIKDNYGYDVGVVILWSKYGDVGHAQTWVVIDDERYIIESTSNEYWTESDHKDKFGKLCKICFVSIQKGREHTKATAEYCRSG